jgi:hypothetical protein
LDIGLAALLALAAPAADAASSYIPAMPEPGIGIPQVTAKFGMRPYADNTFYFIELEKVRSRTSESQSSPRPMA